MPKGKVAWPAAGQAEAKQKMLAGNRGMVPMMIFLPNREEILEAAGESFKEMNTVQNGKGKGPEKGRDLSKWREGYDFIDWGHPQNGTPWETPQNGLKQADPKATGYQND